MALLDIDERERRLNYLGYCEYNSTTIKAFQKKAFPNMPKQHDGKYGINTDRALRHFYNVEKVTKNFSPTEFRCNCGRCTGYPSYMKQVELKHLQKIRTHYGKPMIITSGLRCSYENSRVGGVRNSGHTRGYAADFYMKGVTDTVANRKKSLSYIKKLDNHEFTYGAYMLDSNGMYRAAGGMGNAMHTETHSPRSTLTKLQKKILKACEAQARYQKNAKYGWESNPTIAKSKKKATCVTTVACVLQRIGILPSGSYVWHDEGKVYGNNNKMTVTYTRKKPSELKSTLKAGDIIIDGDPHDNGSGSHIFILTGQWSGNYPIIWDNWSGQEGKGAYVYKRNRSLIAIIRLK